MAGTGRRLEGSSGNEFVVTGGIGRYRRGCMKAHRSRCLVERSRLCGSGEEQQICWGVPGACSTLVYGHLMRFPHELLESESQGQWRCANIGRGMYEEPVWVTGAGFVPLALVMPPLQRLLLLIDSVCMGEGRRRTL